MRKILSVFFALLVSVSSANADGMLSLMGFGAGQSAVPPLPSVTYNGYYTDPANSTSHSMSVSTGTAATGRVIVAAIKSCTTGGPSAVMLNGASMSVAPSTNNIALARIVLSTGTSATLTYTTPVSCLVDAGVWSLYNLNSSVPVASTSTSSTSNGSCTIATQQDGIMIAAANTSLSGGSSISMSGLDSVSYSNQAVQATSRSSGGYAITPSTSDTATITYSPTATSANSVCASWR